MLTMPPSLSSATRIITIFSLVILFTLSFTVSYGTRDAIDTLPQDSLFPFNKHDLLHHPHAFHHDRAENEVVPSGQISVSLSSAAQSPSLSLSSANTQSSVQSVSSPIPTSSSSSFPSSPSPSTSFLSSSLSTSSPTSSITSASISSAPLLSSSSSSSFLSTTVPSLQTTTRPTTSASQVASQLAVFPTTTFDQGVSNAVTGFLITSTGSTSTVSASPTAGAISKGFFANKAAVGVTFSIVGIICGLAVTVALVTLIKRYRESRAADDDEFFEKYLGSGAGGRGDNLLDEPAEVGQGPLGASATDINTFPAPSDAYPDRAIHFGQSNPGSVLRPDQYGIDYPPEAPKATTTPANQSSNVQGGYAYDSGPSASHPFADQANIPRIGAAPVTYPRPVFGRAQEMVTTDSYYGPNSAGVGARGMGIAH